MLFTILIGDKDFVAVELLWEVGGGAPRGLRFSSVLGEPDRGAGLVTERPATVGGFIILGLWWFRRGL